MSLSLRALHSRIQRNYHFFHACDKAPRLRLTTSPQSHTLHTTPISFQTISDIRQGHATDPKNKHPEDTQTQSVRGAAKARKDESNAAIDAADESAKTSEDEKRPKDMGSGNPEKIGFVEQVGGASGSARKFEREEGKQ